MMLVCVLLDGDLWVICAWTISCGLRLFVLDAVVVLLRFAILCVLCL